MKTHRLILLFTALAAFALPAKSISFDDGIVGKLVYQKEGIKIIRSEYERNVEGDFWYAVGFKQDSFPEDRYFKIVIEYRVKLYSHEEASEIEGKTEFPFYRYSEVAGVYRRCVYYEIRRELGWQSEKSSFWIKPGEWSDQDSLQTLSNGMDLKIINIHVSDMGAEVPEAFRNRAAVFGKNWKKVEPATQ
jgi:hypothetical protein